MMNKRKTMDKNAIICGDNVSVLKGFPEQYFDLIVTSPPYGKIRDYNGYSFDFEGLASQLARVLKNGGILAWNTADQIVNRGESMRSFKDALFFGDVLGLTLHQTLYIHGGGPPPDPTRYVRDVGYTFVFSKGKSKTLNILKDKKNKNPGRSGGLYTIREKDGSLSKRGGTIRPVMGKRGAIWKCLAGKGHTTKDKFAYKHPALMSEKLADGLIRSYSNPDDLVLDPFCGGGTTLKMAKQLSRGYIGIDISPEYCSLSKRRVEAGKVPLFVME